MAHVHVMHMLFMRVHACMRTRMSLSLSMRRSLAYRLRVRRVSPSRRPATSRGSLLPSLRTRTARSTRLRATRPSPLEWLCAD